MLSYWTWATLVFLVICLKADPYPIHGKLSWLHDFHIFSCRFVEFCGQAAPKDEDTPEKRWPASYWWAPAGSSSSAVGKLCIPPAPSPEVLMKNRKTWRFQMCPSSFTWHLTETISNSTTVCIIDLHVTRTEHEADSSKSIGFVTFAFTIAAISTGIGQWCT